MSTNIMRKQANRIGGVEELSEYVKRVMKRNGLSLRDVQRRSDGKITQGYVSQVVQGSYSNLSIQKLKALAQGLGVDEAELFAIASGSPGETDGQSPAGPGHFDVVKFSEVMREVAANPDVIKTIELLTRLSPESRAIVYKMVSSLYESEVMESDGRG